MPGPKTGFSCARGSWVSGALCEVSADGKHALFSVGRSFTPGKYGGCGRRPDHLNDHSSASTEKIVIAIITAPNVLVCQLEAVPLIKRNHRNRRGELKRVPTRPIDNVIPRRHPPVFDVISPMDACGFWVQNKRLNPCPAKYRDLHYLLHRPATAIVTALITLPEPASPA